MATTFKVNDFIPNAPKMAGQSTYNLIGRTTSDILFNKDMMSITNKIAACGLVNGQSVTILDSKPPSAGDTLLMQDGFLCWTNLSEYIASNISNLEKSVDDLHEIVDDTCQTTRSIKKAIDKLTGDLSKTKYDIVQYVDKAIADHYDTIKDNLVIKDSSAIKENTTTETDDQSDEVMPNGLATLSGGTVTIKLRVPANSYPLITIMPGKPPVGQVWCSQLSNESMTISSTNKGAEFSIFYQFVKLSMM